MQPEGGSMATVVTRAVAICGLLVASSSLSCVHPIFVYRVSPLNPPPEDIQEEAEFSDGSVSVDIGAFAGVHSDRIGVCLRISNAGNEPVRLSAKELTLSSARGYVLDDKRVSDVRLQLDSLIVIGTGETWLYLSWQLGEEARFWSDLMPLRLQVGSFKGSTEQELLHIPAIFVFKKDARLVNY